jgi:hypothetical protein
MTRTTQRLVTFPRPFAVSGIDGMVPAGVYLTETDEEAVDVVSRLAWRRVSTSIHIAADGVTRVIPISPEELDELLLRDEPLAASR